MVRMLLSMLPMRLPPGGRDTFMPISGHRPPRFHHFFSSIVTIFAALFFTPAGSATDPLVMLAAYDGVINPVSAEYLHDALAAAEQEGAQALIIALKIGRAH